MTGAESRQAWLVLAAAMLPIAAAWWVKAILEPRPYWVFHYDPEVAYFLSGLNLLQGRAPILVEHPGVPLQIIGAGLAAVTGHTRPLAIEGFRLPAYTVGALLGAAGVLLLLRTILAGLPALVQIAALWTYFAFPRALQFQTIWSPEVLYVPAGALALAAAWRFAEAPTTQRACVMGAALGLCLALKFTFAIWLPGILAVAVLCAAAVGRGRALLACVGGVALAFLVGTAAGAARYGYVSSWLLGVVTRSGLYGRGALGWPAFDTVRSNLSEAMMLSEALCWTWACAAVVLGLHLLRDATARGRRAALAVLPLTAIPAAYALTFRDLQMRYALPGALAGVLLLALAARAIDWSRGRVALPAAALVGSGLLLGQALGNDLAAHTALVATGLRTRSAIDALLARADSGPHPVVVYGWRAPEPAFALRLAAYARAHHLEEIERAFPDVGDYEPWNGVVHLPAGRTRWDVLVLAERDLARFPEPIGPIVGAAEGFVVLRAPGTAAHSSVKRANTVTDLGLRP